MWREKGQTAQTTQPSDSTLKENSKTESWFGNIMGAVMHDGNENKKNKMQEWEKERE